ncbi:MAG: hypothetical protein ACP5RH_01560 [Leptodesmis sp.]|uniref:hypothetical protein n=1 Tax=Leptodesmis sp. TaxID=3100501 RepID=UPI003D0AE4E2
MFLTLSPNLPATATPAGTGFAFTFSTSPDGTPSTGNLFSIISLTPTSPLANSASVTIPNYSGNTIALTPPANTSAITAIAVPGDGIYTPAADPLDPQQGEFTYSGSGQATVYLRGNSQPPVGTSAIVYYLSGTYTPQTLPTDEVPGPFPGFYSQWNVEVQVDFQRSFEQPPSATIRITTIEDKRQQILDAFRNKTFVQIYDMGFQVDNTKFKHLPPGTYPDRWVEIEIRLTGAHQYKLEEVPVKLLAAVPADQQRSPKKYVPIANFCKLAGLNYTGVPLTVVLPQDTAYDASNTVGSILTEHVRLGEAFVYYSNPNAIETRKFGKTKVHYLSEADILSECNYSYPGKEFIYQNCQLSEVYKNTEMTLQYTQGEDQIYPRTICKPLQDPSIPPDNVTELRDGNLCFDQGGPTKEQVCTDYIGDTVMRETKVKYGFAFCAIDTYYYATVNVNGTDVKRWIYDESIDPANFWRIVETSTTTYQRNQFGYLERVLTRGQILTRLKQESSKETQALKASYYATTDAATANSLTKQIDAYRVFFPLPLEKTTTNDLEYFANFYPDVPIFPDDPRVDASNFVPEMFCIREVTNEISYGVFNDPASSTSKAKPPIVVGKIFNSTKEITITSNIKGSEAFEITESTQNSEGSNLKNNLAIAPTTVCKGRPSPAERGDIRVTLVGPTPAGAVDPQKYRYVLNTRGNGYGVYDPPQGSVSYPTDSPEVGRLAAETESAIANSEGSEKLDLVVTYDRSFQEGDLVVYKGVTYVIFSISWTENIYQNDVRNPDGMTLSLGRYLRPPVNLTYMPILDKVGRPA